MSALVPTRRRHRPALYRGPARCCSQPHKHTTPNTTPLNVLATPPNLPTTPPHGHNAHPPANPPHPALPHPNTNMRLFPLTTPALHRRLHLLVATRPALLPPAQGPPDLRQRSGRRARLVDHEQRDPRPPVRRGRGVVSGFPDRGPAELRRAVPGVSKGGDCAGGWGRGRGRR